MFYKARGSVTVFICIILAAIIPFSCIMIDLARISWAKAQAKAALKICTESMLAGYDRQLKEQYGLFSIYPQGTDAMEKEIYELMSQNLNANASVDGVTDLYKFKVKSVQAIPLYNYSEPFVLQEQVAEFMKYRAPIAAVQEVYEKLKVISGLIKEGDMVEQKITVDKLMNDIRSNLVNISCMINGVLNEFNPLQTDNITFKELKLSDAQSYISTAESHIRDANSNIDAIDDAKSDYYSIYDSFISTKETYEDLIAQRDEVKRKLDEKREKLANQKGSSGSLPSEISALEIEYTALENSCTEVYNSFSSTLVSLDSSKSDFDEALDFAASSVVDAINSNQNAINQLKSLKDHISQYIIYHEDILEIIDEVLPKLNDLDNKVEKLKNDAKDEDGAISGTVSGSLDKQMKSIEVGTFETAKGQLNNNLIKLKAWEQLVGSSLEVLTAESDALNDTLENAQDVKTDIQDKTKSYDGYSDYARIGTEIKSLKTSLYDLEEVSEMKGIYEVPIYILEPKANTTEKEAFGRWFASNYGDKESEKSPKKDDKDLKKIRKGIGNIAKNAAVEEKDKDEYEGINADPQSIEERFKTIPSIKGITHSNNAIMQIGRVVQESQDNQIAHENPFEKPVEGLTKVNEEEQTFFDYEMERMRDFMPLIDEAISDDMESLLESMYMNEYIVSAFKNETSKNGIEHDIGYNRPLDKTFFKQAEVEYILFGNKDVKSNVNATKRSLFATRLLFNLLHVYTSTEKVSTALTLATAISGWTIFGIPIVKNLILIAWAGAEAYLDVDLLMKGESVPLVKTASSWQLDTGGLKDKLMEILTTDVKEFLTDKVDDTIGQTSEAIEESVSGIINGYIDQAFAPFEDSIDELPGQIDESVSNDVKTLISQTGNDFLNNLSFDNLDSFKSSLKTGTKNLTNSISGKIKSYSQEKVLNFKNKLKEEIRELIFESSGYKKLENSLKTLGNDIISNGIDSVGGQMEDAFGKDDKSGKNNITGRLIRMDYTDYLRLFLFAVSAETKALRTADIIQLNMQEVARKYDLSIDNYNTYLFIKVELDINTWFIPKSLFKKNNSGMMTIEWCQGY